MNDQQHERELLTLKTIAETLNRSSDLKPMLQSVLEELLAVTGLQTGWIFLSGGRPEFTCTADVRLPHALSMNNKHPMCSGTCWCLNKYWDGKLNQAFNIIECKRLEDAVKNDLGDTEGLTHHATVPLTAAGETFGLLNVGSPGKEKFNEEELTLLESVAYQIGTAIKRTKLYQNEQKRAEHYAKLETLTRELWKREQGKDIINGIVEQTATSFEWPIVGYCSQEENHIIVHSVYEDGHLQTVHQLYRLDNFQDLIDAVQLEKPISLSKQSPFFSETGFIIARNVSILGNHIGILFAVSHKNTDFNQSEGDVLKAIADHTALAIEHARINEKRQELIISEERNRLARDLHDSVSQKLFSLSMTARGARDLQEENPILRDALKDIQQMAQEAMREMKTLIWQLRPVGMKAGIMTSLETYAVGLDLKPNCHISGFKILPAPIEEALFRIGQESLNNVQKHASVNKVSLFLKIDDHNATLIIEDKGKGFNLETVGSYTLGLKGMRERADVLGGHLSIKSEVNKGTKITVILPF